MCHQVMFCFCTMLHLKLPQICDFLSSLANDAREWRVLLSYLQQLERHPAVLAELRQAVLQGHGEGSSFMDAMQRGGRHHQVRIEGGGQP